MRKTYTLAIVMIAVAGVAWTGALAVHADERSVDRLRVDLNVDQSWMEFAGQVVNPDPTTSVQFGYLTFLRGVDRLFNEGVAGPDTARFTFFNDTTTVGVRNHGPLRIITREGTTTIYLSAGGSSFASPESFRNGTPIQTSRLRHVVVLNLTNNSFTTLFENVVTSVSGVDVDGRELRLGRVGDMFKITVLGQTVAPVPPNGWIAGFAVGVVRPSEEKD
jgi:hypothetical protein